MMDATLQPKGEPTRHPEAFYQGLRLCGVDGHNTEAGADDLIPYGIGG
jgi:hypothetical protein